MPLSSGTALGPYEILSPLGAGGMGEVYKARDTRLDRTVAIKVLPEHVAADPDLKLRFEREAKTISSLNHPHICTLHDIGEQDGIDFLVMEYLEGDTLAQRLERGALPLDQALKIAIEIADALDKAHRQGIVHRDLKPGNIMLTKAGAKLLDFGLAKLRPPGTVGAEGFSAAATKSEPLTARGTLLGTLPYMAPEQLEGQEADHRTDVFAFGAVAYEMVTGQRAFQAESQASLIGAILKDDPPLLSTLQPMTPRSLDRVIRECLAKDPDERWQSTGDLRRELHWVTESVAEPSDTRAVSVGQRSGPWRVMVPWAVAGFAALTAAVAVWSRGPASPDQPAAHFALPVTGQLPLGQGRLIALSPDGREVVYVAVTEEGDQLYRRPLNQLESVPIPGTDGARAPFFSPDGEWLAFSAPDGNLQRLSLPAGLPTTLCDCNAGAFRNGAWGADGTIVYTDSYTRGLMRVSSAGGIPEPVTTVEEGESRHDEPAFLPDGQGVLFHVWSESTTTAQLAAVDLRSGERRLLGNGFSPQYVPTGHLIYARAGGSLWAVPFDADRLEMTGEPVPVFEGVRIEGGSAVQFTFAKNGSAAYIAGGTSEIDRTLVWVDREGWEKSLPASPQPYEDATVSPDGTRVAVTVRGADNTDVWIWDLTSDTLTRLTFDAAVDQYPLWTPDSERVVFRSDREDGGLFWKAADGTGATERLLADTNVFAPSTWSADGRLIFEDQGGRGPRNISMLTVDGEPRVEVLLDTEFYEGTAAISPDGRWIAYSSDETGQVEVHVRPFPAVDSGHWQVSTSGGFQPVWSPHERELIYRGSGGLIVAPFETEPTFASGTPEFLLDTGGYTNRRSPRFYDVSPDGQRFLLTRGDTSTPAQIVVIQDWFEELTARVPTN